MKIKSTIMPVIIGATTLLTLCENKIQKPITKTIPKIENNIKFQTILKDTFSNVLSDEHKVVEFNKLLKTYKKQTDNYVVIDKKNCVAKVYNPDGDVLYKTEVALGRTWGDKRNAGYMVPEIKVKSYTTTPGEYTVSREGTSLPKDNKLYGERVLSVSGDHTKEICKGLTTLALHRVPATPQGRLRENVFNNGTLKDNRVSFGCVNFLVESYDKVRKLIKGKGTKVYILPEEKGNSLHLEKQKDGSYKFFQTRYRHEYQEKNKK